MIGTGILGFQAIFINGFFGKALLIFTLFLGVLILLSFITTRVLKKLIR